MQQSEISIIKQLTGVSDSDIVLSDRGFFSRCYIINGGEIVFKFKKREDTDYKNEATILNNLKDKSLCVAIQSVGWDDKNGAYLGLYGVKGTAIKDLTLEKEEKNKVAKTLASFIKELRPLKLESVKTFHLEDEIAVWQDRYKRSVPVLKQHFSPEELSRIESFMTKEMPETLLSLGEKLVLSHGDLWENNIFLNEGELGVIDFSDGGYYDEAAELMYLEDDELCENILNALSADEILRKKIETRRLAKNIFILSAYKDNPPIELVTRVRVERTTSSLGRNCSIH